MPWLLRSALVAALLLPSLKTVAFDENAKPAINPELLAADQLIARASSRRPKRAIRRF